MLLSFAGTQSVRDQKAPWRCSLRGAHLTGEHLTLLACAVKAEEVYQIDVKRQLTAAAFLKQHRIELSGS
jgi:hypothetical protein